MYVTFKIWEEHGFTLWHNYVLVLSFFSSHTKEYNIRSNVEGSSKFLLT